MITANSPLFCSSRAASSVSVLAMPSGVAWLTKNSRASGSASASHVSTWMPRARAFRRTVEIPARFSTATAMTSTRRVIQFSISSFCFAASRLVGPSQIKSTFRSRAASSAPARQLTKYGSPLAFGITAMTGRCLGGGPAPDRDRSAVLPNECTSQTLVPATMIEPSRIVPHRTATWLFFIVDCSLLIADCSLLIADCSKWIADASVPLADG